MLVRHPAVTVLLQPRRHDRWLGAGLHRSRPLAGDSGPAPDMPGGLPEAAGDPSGPGNNRASGGMLRNRTGEEA